jgi:fibronectin type 3 domain-containing protein
VIVTWQAPAVAGTPAFTQYSIWRGANAGSIALLANVTSGILSYNDSVVTNGQTYVYAMKAVNTVGSSAASNIATATPAVSGTAPGAPTGLAADGLKNKISLTWTAPANPGSGVFNYLVYRGTTVGGEGSSPIATVTGTTYLDTTVTPGTPYYYVVKANNTYGMSPASSEATGTALAATVPSAPQSFTAAPGPNKVALNWAAPADNGGAIILGYRVFRSSAGGAYSQLGSDLSASTLSYVDTSGTAGTTYSYYVVAVNSVGAGPQSTVQSAAPESGGGGSTDNTMLYAGIGVAVVIIVAIIGIFWYMRSKKTPPKTP